MFAYIKKNKYIVWRNGLIEKEIKKVTQRTQSFLNKTIYRVKQIKFKKRETDYSKTNIWKIEKFFNREIGKATNKNDLSQVELLQHIESIIIKFLESELKKYAEINILKRLNKLEQVINDLFHKEWIKLFERFNNEAFWVKTDPSTNNSVESKLAFVNNKDDIKILTDFITELEKSDKFGILVSFDQDFQKNRDQIVILFPFLTIVRPLYYSLAREGNL